MHLKNTLFGTESTDQEMVPDSSERNSNVKLEPEMNDNDPQNLNEQKLDLSVPASVNNFEEEIEDGESEDEKLFKEIDLISY